MIVVSVSLVIEWLFIIAGMVVVSLFVDMGWKKLSHKKLQKEDEKNYKTKIEN